MTITYTTIFDTITVPILHRVDFGTNSYISDLYDPTLLTELDHHVDAWLKENCRHAYYHSPGYMREKFIEFEDDEEEN